MVSMHPTYPFIPRHEIVDVGFALLAKTEASAGNSDDELSIREAWDVRWKTQSPLDRLLGRYVLHGAILSAVARPGPDQRRPAILPAPLV